MGKLTAMGVKKLAEPGRYSDGEGYRRTDHLDKRKPLMDEWAGYCLS